MNTHTNTVRFRSALAEAPHLREQSERVTLWWETFHSLLRCGVYTNNAVEQAATIHGLMPADISAPHFDGKWWPVFTVFPTGDRR